MIFLSLIQKIAIRELFKKEIPCIFISVANQVPFGLLDPGSGSISQRYGSGSGSFHHQAKK